MRRRTGAARAATFFRVSAVANARVEGAWCVCQRSTALLIAGRGNLEVPDRRPSDQSMEFSAADRSADTRKAKPIHGRRATSLPGRYEQDGWT